MKKLAYILLAEGFEEAEAVVPADILRRLEIEALLVGVGAKTVRGAHGIEITADKTLNRVMDVLPDALILPGGMPGAKNLDANPKVRELLLKTAQAGGIIAAICAAPMVPGRLGLLQGRRAVCYPGFEEHLTGALPTDSPVVRDGQFITGKGPGAACDFGFEIGAALTDDVSAAFVRRAMFP